MEFLGSNIISINQFEKDDIELIFKTADSLIPFANRSKLTKVLDGAILSNMFFEPSTRTRISFGSAFNILGGSVRETTEMDSTSLKKGEYYWKDIEGLEVYTTKDSYIGSVDFIFNNGANDILAIKQNKELVYIPYINDHIEVIPNEKIIIDHETI